MINKKGNWTLSAVLGVAGIAGIILPLVSDLSKWFMLLGILFLFLAFMANR